MRIERFGWSTDAERDQFVKAWVSPVQPVVTQVTEAPVRGRGGNNGRGGNRGAALAAAAADPAAPAAGARGDAAAAAGRGGRGGRGARGGDDAPPLPPVPVTPTSSLSAALQKAPTVGMRWTSETVGYAIRYGYRLPQPDGSERIILATDRRLGAWNTFWKPVGTLRQPTTHSP